MYDEKTRTITFPHVVPTPILTDDEGRPRRFGMNDITGGMKRIADFGLTRNSFFGGNVAVLGRISRYGFYACVNAFNNAIMGFYVHDGAEVTPEGRRVLERRFQGCTVRFETVPEQGMTDAEIQARDRARKAALEHGIDPEIVGHSTAKELEGLIRAVDSGISERAIAVEAPAKDSVDKRGTEIQVRMSGSPETARRAVSRSRRSPVI